MNRLWPTLFVLVLAGAFAGEPVAATQHATILSPPHWLPAAESQTLDGMFGGAKPIHTSYLLYSLKIAVIFEFDHVVICGGCSAPSNAALPRRKVIRVGFDRQTHRLTGAMQFCEARSTEPSRASCIRR